MLQLTVRDTPGTSQLCPRCGKKITQVDKKTRQLWCDECKRWMDRDVAAAMNLSVKGRASFPMMALERVCSNVHKGLQAKQ